MLLSPGKTAYGAGKCAGENGACDNCWKCTSSIQYQYCWETYIEEGGGSSGGGDGTSGGSGTTTPPNPCGGPKNPQPFSKDNNFETGQDNFNEPCSGGGGWTPLPIEGNTLSTLDILTVKLNLNASEVNWLHNKQIFAEEISRFLSISQTAEDPFTNLAFFPYENTKAIIAAKSTLETAMQEILETGFTQTHFNILTSYLPDPQNQTSYDPMWAFYFAVECINIKVEHPEWSNARVYLEASLDLVHILLDGAGMVPVVGEIADLVSGGIYLLQGDGLNATLSFAATIPVAGWAATTAKYAKKLIVVADGSKRTLKWFKEANGFIKFGDRGLLRKVLGLAKDDARVAHHLIPWEHEVDELVQKAASGSNAFHLNEILNGMPLTAIQHNSGGHSLYNSKVKAKLVSIVQQGGGNSNFTPNFAAQKVRELATQIENWILAHPNESINNITL